MKYNYFIDIDNPQELEEGAAVRFKDYKHDFINMTERHFVNTQFDVISIILTYDSTQAITVLYHSDKLYYIRLYNLESESMNEYQLTGRHIKCH
jgi:hypothetical protein